MLKNEQHTFALKVATHPDPVKVKVNQRRGLKHLKVIVNATGDVVLNIPYGISRARAFAFLDDQREWIASTMLKVPPQVSLGCYLSEHPTVSALGREYAVSFHEAKKAGFSFDYTKGCVEFNREDMDETETVLLKSLRAFAGEMVPLRVTDFARQRGLSFARVSVRDQRSRWGSCSERRTLSFNWRMVLLPPVLQDYLIWHELAHLVHLNHSPDFWSQVSVFDPGWQEHDAAISKHSNVLMRLGRKKG